MSEVKINVNDIPEEGLELKKSIDVNAQELDCNGITFPSPIDINIKAQKTLKEVFVEVHLEAAYKISCARCLEAFEKQVDKRTSRVYEIPRSGDIELWKDLREDLILDFPMKPLCKNDCRGLCFICGHNLNTGPCSH